MTAEWTLTAQWVLPVDQPPLERGRVVIKGERIAAILPNDGQTADLDLGDVAVLPGLVNAHTHLDLTGMRGLAPPSPDFTAWLKQVIAFRRSRSPQQIQTDIAAGIKASLRHGTTLIGDISGDGGSWEQLAGSPLRAVVFKELIGLKSDQGEAIAQGAREWLFDRRSLPTCRPGLSPHAPFSVHKHLFRAAAIIANAFGVPLASHVAESWAEWELLIGRSGPFVSFLKELGVWEPEGIANHPWEVIASIWNEGPGLRSLMIHGNYLTPEREFPDKSSIVYCPRTHAAFGHPPHPFREFLKRGTRVALGTDGLSSNPDLSVLTEARFIHQNHPDLEDSVILKMATLSGAEALGWADETGSLTPGKSADLVVIPVPAKSFDPWEAVLEGEAGVQAVLIRGQWVSLA